MKTEQLYTLLNSFKSEIIGAENITVKDTASFISFGRTVMATDNNKDSCYQALADRIGRTIVLYEQLVRKNLVERMDTMEFGAILQTIETKSIANAKQNNSWIYGSTSNVIEQQNPFEILKSDDTALLVQYFSKRGTWEIDKKIYDIQMNDAFISETAGSAFVEMIFQDMYNAMTLAENDLQHGVISTAIASAIHAGTKKTNPIPTMARNLLNEYNTLTNAGLTVATALINKEFLRYCAKEILLVTKKMRDPSIFYNELGATKWHESPQVRLLTNYATASDAYLSADTYHKELVALPDYDTVNFWQARGTTDDFTTVSSVNIKVHEGDADATGTDVSQSGVIAYVCDPRRQGYMFDRIRTKAMYNGASECVDYYHKADQGFFINRARCGVVFYIAEV